MCKRLHTYQRTQSYPTVHTAVANGELKALVVAQLNFSLRSCCHYMCCPDEKTLSKQCDYNMALRRFAHTPPQSTAVKTH